MWARVVRFHGDPADRDRGVALLNEQLIPTMRQWDGFMSGYWLADKEGKMIGVTLFENEDALKASEAAAEALRERGKEVGVTIDSVEAFEVIAQA
jgi:hypothetical protein